MGLLLRGVGSFFVQHMSSVAPSLHLELHKKFIHNLDRAKDSYEFAVTDQLRMSGARPFVVAIWKHYVICI